MELLGKTYDEMIRLMEERYGKGRYHGDGLFRRIFREGRFDLLGSTAFQANPGLAAQVEADFPGELPRIEMVAEDGVVQGDRGTSIRPAGEARGATIKFLFQMADGEGVESVLIPMEGYNTLCISCQAGCGRGCVFCETGGGGLRRQLSASEIVGQVFMVRHILKHEVSKLVFMGMGEPLDNLDAVIQAIDIMADERGLNIPRSAMTLSTVGVIPGLNRLAELARRNDRRYYHTLRLAVSLHAPDDELRSRLMPVNRQYPLNDLFQALKGFPLPPRGRIFFEYVLLPGINDSREEAKKLIALLKRHADLPSSVNLLFYNPTRAGSQALYGEAVLGVGSDPSPLGVRPQASWGQTLAPSGSGPKGKGSGAKGLAFFSDQEKQAEQGMQLFFRTLLDAEIPVRIRHSRGSLVGAACGQLAGVRP